MGPEFPGSSTMLISEATTHNTFASHNFRYYPRYWDLMVMSFINGLVKHGEIKILVFLFSFNFFSHLSIFSPFHFKKLRRET
jgi:hypothetical protein